MTTLIDKLRTAETGSPELSRMVLDERGIDLPVAFCEVTQSIDAALTLVPEGWVWSKASDGYVMVSKKQGSRIIAGCHHKSLPIAICIAVLSIPENKRGV